MYFSLHTMSFLPCVQFLLFTYSCGIYFRFLKKSTSLMFEWVICLLDMPVLSPPTSHLTVYEASAEHKHSPHQWALRSEQNGREFCQPEPKQQSILVQFRLFKWVFFLSKHVRSWMEPFESIWIKTCCAERIFLRSFRDLDLKQTK